MTRMLSLALALATTLPAVAAARGRFLGDRGPSTFATPAILKKNVALWRTIYGKHDSLHTVFYDRGTMRVLRVVDYSRYGDDTSARREARDREIERLERILKRLRRRRPRTRLERSLRAKYTRRSLRSAHRRIAAHRGLADKFAAGLKRLAKYRPYVEQVLRRHRLPVDLLALAMTESLFNPQARSWAGAYGVWQFIGSTGKRYLHMNRVIDERRDPIVSTDAAARMLKRNLERLKRWPLAITGYNYGPNGMARAAREVGSHDLTRILRRFRSRRFRFASRNYYASFLAARQVMQRWRRYFPRLHLPSPLRFVTLALPASAHLRHVARHCGVKVARITALNPGLTRAARRSRLRLPQGFPLRIPRNVARRCRRDFHRVKGARRRLGRRLRIHRVRRGESLHSVARRYRTSVRTLIALNRHRLRSRRSLWVGERLRVPRRGSVGFTVVPVVTRGS